MHFETGLSPAPLSPPRSPALPRSALGRPGPSPTLLYPSPTNLSRPGTSERSRPGSALTPGPSPAKRPASREALERAARALA